MQKKTLLVILVLLVIISLGTSIYFLKNNQTDTILTLTSTATSTKDVCNLDLIVNGLDSSGMIDEETCRQLNVLYREGKIAGNQGDIYENRDNLHVNFCESWTPNPDCPIVNRLFPQHNWKFSSSGIAHTPSKSITVGQASYRGEAEHGIAYVYYKNQKNALEAYHLYTNNNLYIYPSLEDDAFIGTRESVDTLINQMLNKEKVNQANTPYIISSKQIAKPGTSDYIIHEASGSEMPFVKLALIALASLKPEVKNHLQNGVTVNGKKISLLIPTVQMLIRYSHKDINTNEDYLNNNEIHNSMYMAHDFKMGIPKAAYKSSKILLMASSLELNDVPPLVQLKIISEDFQDSEKLFDTPGAIARTVKYNTNNRKIIVSAEESFDYEGNNENFEYVWKILQGDDSSAKITVDKNNPAMATIEFYPISNTDRIDIGVFVKKKSGNYYSVPGIISNYIHA